MIESTSANESAICVGRNEGAQAWRHRLTELGWSCDVLEGPSGLIPRLRGPRRPDVVLLFPETGDREFVQLCRDIKLDLRTKFVGVVFVLPDGCYDAESIRAFRARAFAMGADDCLTDSDDEAEALVRVRKTARLTRATDSLEDSVTVVTAIAKLVEGRDRYTHGHVERVSEYSVALGRSLGLDQRALEILRIGGIVHDIGKVVIPDAILNKPGALTDEEFGVIREHPVVGFDLLEPMRSFKEVLPIVRWHHEKPNGRGYPDGLSGDEIPLRARIAGVVDVYDALSTTRSYRNAMPPEKCEAIMRDAAEKGDLDAELVKLFLNLLGQFGAHAAAA